MDALQIRVLYNVVLSRNYSFFKTNEMTGDYWLCTIKLQSSLLAIRQVIF